MDGGGLCEQLRVGDELTDIDGVGLCQGLDGAEDNRLCDGLVEVKGVGLCKGLLVADDALVDGPKPTTWDLAK
jgi:hypothetical protein